MKKINTVLITGVAGFIGSNLLDFLIANTDWKIDGVDDLSTGSLKNIEHHFNNSRFVLHQQKVKEITSLKNYQVVFHLAALPRIQPSFELIIEHIEANVTQAVHLLELMIKDNYYPRLVYSGSSAIYGTPTIIPTPETEKIDCLSPYAFQKYEVEKYLELIATRFPLDYVTLRYFNPYGPRSYNPQNPFNAYSSVVGIFLYKAKYNLPLLITGDGSQKRDFIHVQDLAKANYHAAIHPQKINTSFNIGFGSTLSVLDLAKLISPNYKFIDKREGEAEITFANIDKAHNILGWQPNLTMENFIREEIKTK